ncbi:MAG: hypothetical protein ACFBSC_05865, partial [Microcoleaceae cyanobacterium]
AGSVNINAQNNISIDNSLVLTQVGLAEIGGQVFAAEGTGGNISINTGNLFVGRGGQLQAQTQGVGSAGSITVNAREGVYFDGTFLDLFSNVAIRTIVVLLLLPLTLLPLTYLP